MVTVEFAGGLDLLFGGVKHSDVSHMGDIGSLIEHLRDDHLRERPELFCCPSRTTPAPRTTVRPGILVLVNDVDWDLLGGLDHVLSPTDSVLFISTLHGG
jgi:ubiquitin related modifier 1